MLRQPAILDTYEEFKRICVKKGVYASKYGLFRGVALSLLAIDAMATDLTDVEYLKDRLSRPEMIQFTMEETGRLQWQPVPSRSKQIMFGSSDVFPISPKRALGAIRALADQAPDAEVVVHVDYDMPGDEFRSVQNAMKAMDEDTSVTYFVPLRSESGRLVFACNDFGTVSELCRTAGLTVA